MVLFYTFLMVTYVTKLLLTITKTTNELMSDILSLINSSLEAIVYKIIAGGGGLYSQSKDQYY